MRNPQRADEAAEVVTDCGEHGFGEADDHCRIERALVRLRYFCFDCNADTYRAGEYCAVTDAVWEAALGPWREACSVRLYQVSGATARPPVDASGFHGRARQPPDWDQKPTDLRARLAGREAERPR